MFRLTWIERLESRWGFGPAAEISLKQNDVAATVEITKPCDISWREVLVVVALCDEDRHVAGHAFPERSFDSVESLRSKVPGMEQVSR